MQLYLSYYYHENLTSKFNTIDKERLLEVAYQAIP